MRVMLILLLIGFALTTYSQTKPAPIYFIDGTPLNDSFKNIFNPSQIKSERISKGYRDTIYITLKDHRKLLALLKKKQLSLHQLAYANIAGLTKNSAIVFFRNDSLLLDTAKVRIPTLSVFKTQVLRATKTSYYGNLPDATFFYIYTTPQPLYIR